MGIHDSVHKAPTTPVKYTGPTPNVVKRTNSNPLEKPGEQTQQQAKSQAQATAASVVSSAINLAGNMASSGANPVVTLGVSLLKDAQEEDKKKDLKSPPTGKSAPPAKATSSGLAQAVQGRIETTMLAARQALELLNGKILEVGSREAKGGKSGLPQNTISKFLNAETVAQKPYTVGLAKAGAEKILEKLEKDFRNKEGVSDEEVTAAAKIINAFLSGSMV